MTQDTVTYGRVVSATVEVSNSGDTARVYDISGEASVSGSTLNDIHGSVTQEGAQLASFNAYSEGTQLNVSYSTQCDRAAILGAIENFIAGVKETATNISINV